MKKAIAVLLSIVAMVTLFSGCANDAPSTPSTNAGTNSNTAQPTSGGKSQVFKLGFNTTAESVRGEMSAEFKKIIESESNGKVMVEIFPAEALGSEQEQIESVLVGAQEFALPGGGAMANIDPVFGAISLPFFTTGYDDAHAKMDGAIGEYWKKAAAAKGYKVLGFGDLGFAQITNSKRPINTVADMKGLKLRSPNEPVLINSMKALGASVATVPFTEVYLALQQGVVDGQFNPMDAIYQTNFHEVQDYMAQVNIFCYNINFLTSDKVWNKMDADTQKIVQTATDAAIEISREYYKKADEEYLGKLQEGFKEITKPDTTEFRAAVQSVYDEFGKGVPKEFMELLEK